MSTFKNITVADLWLGTPEGARMKVAPGATFTGSNYYQRFTAAGGMADPILECLSDDGIPYSPLSVPNTLRSWEFLVAPGEDWADHRINFLDPTVFGAPAQFVQIMVDDSPVLVRVNGDPRSTFRMDADSTQVFNKGELLLGMIEFKNPHPSGGVPSSLRLLSASSPHPG